MAKRKQHTHEIIIRLRFNKPCTRKVALREARENIHGDFYPYPREDDEPDRMKVKGFRHHRETI